MGVQAKHVSLLPSWLLLRSSFASKFIAFCFWKPEETCEDAPWWWEWGKDKSFYSEAVVLPVSLLFAAAVTWGWNIRLCEIRSEAFSIGALWCLWSSTIQNRTRIEFPEIWKASTDTFSITPPPKARLNHDTYRSEDWEWVNSFLRAFKPKITLFKKILLVWMNWTKMVLQVQHKQTNFGSST